ncbi:MAG: hypothetical protein BGO08_11135 [Altererythrobacter sp. 66-12]|nr:MAG: hypothetical protein BGO08_11135 [Altererythrobacter sp. 66-12]
MIETAATSAGGALDGTCPPRAIDKTPPDKSATGAPMDQIAVIQTLMTGILYNDGLRRFSRGWSCQERHPVDLHNAVRQPAR